MRDDYEITVDDQRLTARCRQPAEGFRITLTFPAQPARSGLEQFKARIVRLVTSQGGHEDERGCDVPGLNREAGEAGR